jgi:rubrerythrin
MPEPSTGAVEALVRDDAARRRFLKMAGTGAAASFGAFALAACGSSKSTTSTTSAVAPAPAAKKSSPDGDLAILNYALTLEYLETEFYDKVVAAGLFKGATGDLVKSFAEQEQSHVDAIVATVKKLGGTPASKPNGKFPIQSASQVAMLAYTVENLGAAAYLGQAAAIKNKDVLAAALSIHSVEARHAASLGTLVKKSVTPDGAFGKPADMKTVLAAVKPFLA